MIAVTVGVYFLLAFRIKLRLDNFGIDVVVAFAVYLIFPRVFLRVQYDIDICGSKRSSAIEDATLGKTYGNFIAAFTGSVSFKYLFDDGTFFLADKHFFVFSVVAVIEFACTMQSFQTGFSLSASGLLREFLRVSFLYFHLDENKKKVYHQDKKRYVFNPLTMIWSKDNYYLLCYDDRHDGISRYRIDRMEDVEAEELPRLEKEEFKDFNAETYRKQIFSMFGGELKKVTIQFSKELLGDVYDKFGTDISIRKASDDEFKTTIEIQVSRTFFVWVVGTLGKVKILTPEVKKEFEGFIAQIKENY